MKKTLLAAAIALAFGFSAHAQEKGTTVANDVFGDNTQTASTNSTQSGAGACRAQDNSSATQDNSAQNNSTGEAAANAMGSSAANNGATSSASFTNAFNTSTATASSTLSGSVSGNTVSFDRQLCHQ